MISACQPHGFRVEAVPFRARLQSPNASGLPQDCVAAKGWINTAANPFCAHA